MGRNRTEGGPAQMISKQSEIAHRPTLLTSLVAVVVLGCASADKAGPPPLAPPGNAATSPSDGEPRNWDDIESSAEPFAELRDRFAHARSLSKQVGQATYYSNSLAGNKTASGRVYDPAQPTMAHRTLPFGSVVRVTRISNGADVIVLVTDRGPFGNRRRIADLSWEAARRLDLLRVGVADVRLEVLQLGKRSVK
ncbi:MAG TPA: septal ring lytic transglycosylase RlpA family protein [Polyangiaceae bacterium]|nr:septal ring lytic transglycosylase RlpA family protein [Polyangiaceae bacterium]